MINIVDSSLEDSSCNLIIITHSTAGTVSKRFTPLLEKAGVTNLVPVSDLGNFSLQPVSLTSKWKYVGFACSVNDFTSTYATIYQIIKNLSIQIPTDIKNIALPLLGAGAGGLNPKNVFCLLYQVINELIPPAIDIDLHILDKKILTELNSLKKSITNRSAKKLVFDFTIDEITEIPWVIEQIEMREFYFEFARKKFNEFLQHKKDNKFYKNLELSFKNSETVFGKFLNNYKIDSPEYHFLILCGELVAYIDFNAYNKSKWNQYKDKRTLARSSVNQTRWIQNFLAFKAANHDYEVLTNSIKNALIYLDQPSENLTMLSWKHRAMATKVLFGSENINQLTEDVNRYFLNKGIICSNPDNNGSLFSRILYIPDIKDLWSKTDELQLKENPLSKYIIDPSIAQLTDEEPAEIIRQRNLQLLMHSDIYAKKDLLNYDTYASIIARLITSNLSSPPFNISIMAPWGKGKTTLMRFIQNKINPNDEKVDQIAEKFSPRRMFHWSIQPHKANIKILENPTIWFNAWKFQKSNQVWSGLADEIILQLALKLQPIDRQKFWFKLNLKRINRSKIIWELIINSVRRVLLPLIYFIIGSLLTWLFSEISFEKTLPQWLTNHSLIAVSLPMLLGVVAAAQKFNTEWAKPTDIDLSKFISRPEYRSKTGYLQEVEDDLKHAITIAIDPAKPAVIFIDDLDRCSPTVITEVVEAINAFISGELSNCYFIIGQDPRIVTASLDAAYENIASKIGKLESEHTSIGRFFLEKFSQLTINLPVMNDTLKKSFTDSLLSALDESAIPKQENQKKLLEEYGALQREILNSNEPSDIFTDKKDIIENQIRLFNPQLISNLQDAILSNAFKNYQVDDNELENIIIDIAEYLDSPRTIKRFLNLFLFYHFFRYTIPGKGLVSIDDQVLGKWLLLMVRWPLLAQAIQWDTEKGFFSGSDCIERAEKFDSLIEKSSDYEQYCELLKAAIPGELSWQCDKDLFEICKGINQQPVKLLEIIDSGVW
jgi:hypothetical protein